MIAVATAVADRAARSWRNRLKSAVVRTSALAHYAVVNARTRAAVSVQRFLERAIDTAAANPKCLVRNQGALAATVFAALRPS